jgi:hypothetical protein
MRNKLSIIFSALVVFALISSTFVPAQAAMVSTIDFENLAEGAIVSNVAYGAGISGDPVSGSVAVYGSNPFFPNTNAAMIFDSACPGGCSGQDNDLYWPHSGKTLIVREDMDSSDPDDSDSRFSISPLLRKFRTRKSPSAASFRVMLRSVGNWVPVRLYGDNVLLPWPSR